MLSLCISENKKTKEITTASTAQNETQIISFISDVKDKNEVKDKLICHVKHFPYNLNMVLTIL